MPRRGGGGSARASPTRARSPVSNVPARAPPPPPAPVAQAAPPAGMAQPRQPGMLAQIATTAAGVAVGSAAGHMITGAMMGGGRDHDQPAEVQQQPQQISTQPMYASQQQQQGEGGPCQMQMKQFLECAQTQHDITLCQGFNEALRECKMSYGMSVWAVCDQLLSWISLLKEQTLFINILCMHRLLDSYMRLIGFIFNSWSLYESNCVPENFWCKTKIHQ